MNSCQTANPKTRSAPLQKPPNLAVMAEARETKLGASLDQIQLGHLEILALLWMVRLLSKQMKLFSRFLPMARSLQGREGFIQGLN